MEREEGKRDRRGGPVRASESRARARVAAQTGAPRSAIALSQITLRHGSVGKYRTGSDTVRELHVDLVAGGF